MKYITKKDLALKRRRPDSHKKDNGYLLIIGGSQDFVGAPALAAKAALRAGCDLVVVAAPSKVAWTINTYSPDIITTKLSGDSFNLIHSRDILKEADKFDCVLIGNGMGQDAETAKFAVRVMKQLSDKGKPLVIDADALKIIGSDEGKKANLLKSLRNVVLTPHQKEFEIMTSQSLPINFEARPRILKSVLSEMRSSENLCGENTILLKGRIDIISSKNQTSFNNTGNEGMTVGGTGDVLAGITASLIAQKNNLFLSSCAAAYVNGAAGDYLFKRKGIGFTASDIIEHIPYFMKQLR